MGAPGLALPTSVASSDPVSVGQRLGSYQEPSEKRLPADPASVEAMSSHEVHRHGVGGEMLPPLRG